MRLNEISKSAKPIHKSGDWIISPEDDEILRKECSLFLKSSEKPLYRGIGYHTTLSDSLYKAKIRKNRAPLDSSGLGTAFFNTIIEQKFKISNIRNQSAFLTTHPYTAAGYGDVAFVIPTDACQFIWSPQISDSTQIFELRDIDFIVQDFIEEEEYLVDLEHNIDPNDDENYRNQEERANNLMSKLYRNAKSSRNNLLKGLNKKELKIIDKFIKGFVWTEMQSYKYAKEFTSAVAEKSIGPDRGEGHEIMMFGAPHYYLVSVKILQKVYGNASKQNAFDIMKKQILTGE